MNATRSALAAYGILKVLAVLIMLPGCQKEDDDDPSNKVTMAFSTDSGYVYMNDTVATEDTLPVAVTITEGDDRLVTFKVLASFDGAAEVTVDSLPISGETFTFEKRIITRAVPGTEQWTFWAQENDGDTYRRALTFLVE